MKKNDFEIENLIKEHLYNELKPNYNYTMTDLRKKLGMRRMGLRRLDFFTVGVVRQMAKEGKLKRIESAGRVFYAKI